MSGVGRRMASGRAGRGVTGFRGGSRGMRNDRAGRVWLWRRRSGGAQRRVSLLTLMVLALLTVVPEANAADVGASGFPLFHLGSWFHTSPSAPKWPKQPGSQPDGKPLPGTPKDSRSGRGVGTGRGKGKGELDPAPLPTARKVTAGKSGAGAGFDARTSKEDAAKRTENSRTYDNADGTVTAEYAQGRENYKAAAAPCSPSTRPWSPAPAASGKKADSETTSFSASADDPELMTSGADGAKHVRSGWPGREGRPGGGRRRGHVSGRAA